MRSLTFQKKKPSHASISKDHDSFGEGSLRINDYYQAPPRRHRRDRREQENPREVRVDQPHFHGKENIEACLDWEMRVEKLFASHKVRKERKIQKKREEDEGKAKEKEIEKPSEGLCESRKNEEYLITPLTSIVKIEKQEKEQKAWEKSVPSHKVIQQEGKVENTLENMLLVEQPSSLLVCKGTLTCTATCLGTCVLPPQEKELLMEFDDVFSKEGPIGLPPFRGIEHQIDLVPK